jgi:hypothetical protein
MIDALTCEAQTGLDIPGLQVRKLSQHLLGAQPTGQEIENVGHADSHPADARTPAALLGIGGNSLAQVHDATSRPCRILLDMWRTRPSAINSWSRGMAFSIFTLRSTVP